MSRGNHFDAFRASNLTHNKLSFVSPPMDASAAPTDCAAPGPLDNDAEWLGPLDELAEWDGGIAPSPLDTAE